MRLRHVVTIAAALLFLVPTSIGVAVGQSAVLDQLSHRPEGSPTSHQLTARLQLGTNISARNLTWNSTLAAPVPLDPNNRGGNGLTGMASQGNITLLFGSTEVGHSRASYDLLYNESNNTWWSVSGSPMPPSVANFSFTYDSAFSGGVALLFDGVNVTSGAPYNGTWIFYFSNYTWRELNFPSGPSARDDAALAADSASPVVLLVGGYNSTSGNADEDWWVLNLTSNLWTDLGIPPTIVPGQLRAFGSSLVSYAPGDFVLFGGCSLSIPIDCTNHTVDISLQPGNVWTFGAPNPTEGPVARAFADWVWDPYNGLVLLYGGEKLSSAPPTLLGDTWAYLPAKNLWISEVTPPKAPLARYLASAAWVNDSSNETLLLAGGCTSIGDSTKYLWRLSPTITVDVKVTNESGQPVDQAVVIVDSDSFSWSNTTDAAGMTTLTQVAPGPLVISGNGTGYYLATTSSPSQPGSTVSVTIVLTTLLPKLIVRSWVSTRPEKTPLGGVTLHWNSSAAQVGGTDALGYWNDTPWHGGPVSITGDKLGFEAATNTTIIPTTGTAFLNITLNESFPSNLTVHVITPSGAGVASAFVNVTNSTDSLSLSGRTNSAGYDNFTDVQSNINIGISATPITGFWPNSTEIYVNPGKMIDVNITVTPWPVIHVHVIGLVYAAGLEDIAGATVERNASNGINTRLIGVTDGFGWANGTTTSGLAFISAIDPAKFYTATVAVVLNRTGPYNLTIELTPWPALHLHVLGENPQGRLIDLVGAQAFRNGTSIGFTAGVDSWLNVTTSSGPGNISADFPSYFISSWKEVSFNYTGVLNVTLILSPLSARLEVEVETTLGPFGNGTKLYPLAFADVNVSPVFGGQPPSFDTNLSGWANQSVFIGSYNVTAWKYGYKPAPSQGVSLALSETQSLEFILYPIYGADVNVLVKDKNTTLPIFNATVDVGSFLFNTTIRAGWANFTDVLPPGRYEILAQAPGYDPNSTNLTLNFKEVVSVELNLTPIHSKSNTVPGNSTFSLVPPDEQYLWWPFIVLPIAFAVGSIIVILAQRSSGNRRDSHP